MSPEDKVALAAAASALIEDSDVDEELNLLEAFVRDETRKPLHARSKEGFKFTEGKL